MGDIVFSASFCGHKRKGRGKNPPRRPKESLVGGEMAGEGRKRRRKGESEERPSKNGIKGNKRHSSALIKFACFSTVVVT